MIPAAANPAPALKPRLRLGGLFKDWTPPAPVVAEIPAGALGYAEPRREPIEKWRTNLPIARDVNERMAGQAVSFTIGSFDLSAFGGAFEAPQALGASDSYGDSTLKDGMPRNDLLLRLAAVLQPPLASFVAPNGVLEWPAPLLNYQRDGIAALLARPELLLADDMGLGKTIQAVASLRILFFRREITSALVVCPASLLRQWQRELAKWAPELIVVALAANAQANAAACGASPRTFASSVMRRCELMSWKRGIAPPSGKRGMWSSLTRQVAHQKPGSRDFPRLQETAAQTPLGFNRNPAGKPNRRRAFHF